MNKTYLSLGSNLGNRENNLRKARVLLETACGYVIAISSIYETEPWGFETDMFFYNQVIEFHTLESAPALLHIIHTAERKLGRKTAAERYSSRPIDIDILFFNEEIIHDMDLIVPHPEIQLRRFVLVPLAEIAPDLIHPVLKKTITELMSACPDKKRVVKLSAH